MYVLIKTKGQIISKGLLVSSNSPKKRIYCYEKFIRSFFGENSRTTKSPFEIIRPLSNAKKEWKMGKFLWPSQNI